MLPVGGKPEGNSKNRNASFLGRGHTPVMRCDVKRDQPGGSSAYLKGGGLLSD